MLDKILKWVNLVGLVVVIVLLWRSGITKLGAYSTVPTQLTDLEVTNKLGVDTEFVAGGTTEMTGVLTATAQARFNTGLISGGAATGFTVSTTATTITPNTISAASICDQNYIPITIGNTTTPTINAPTAAALYADCLTTNGDVKDVVIYNSSAATATLFAANTSGTLYYDVSATVAAADIAILRFIRESATVLRIILLNVAS